MDIQDSINLQSRKLVLAGNLYFIKADFYQLAKLISIFANNGKVIDLDKGGFSYRLNDAVVPMFGIEMNQFVFGYAYDITLSDIKTYSQGSHELIFIYKIGGSSSTASY